MTLIEIKTSAREFTISAEPGQTLASAIWLSGEVEPLPLCSGLGCCGLCRVKFLSAPPAPLKAEIEKLGPEKIAEGWRLACRHVCGNGRPCAEDAAPGNASRAEEGAAICLELPQAHAPAKKPYFSFLEADISAPLLLAVDLGTTSIHYAAYPADSISNSNYIDSVPVRENTTASQIKSFEERGMGAWGKGEKHFSQKWFSPFPRHPIAAGHELNPQFGAGAEVMSRLAMAATAQGQKRLAEPVIRLLQRIAENLPGPVEEICLAANTAMTAILLNKNISGLAAAPYRLDYAGGNMERLPGLPPIFIPPLLGPFVGADISAGLAALLEARKPEYPFLLADMGTNGEFALATAPEKILIASVPLGPALEGIGLTHGKMAGEGVVGGFVLEPGGLVWRDTSSGGIFRSGHVREEYTPLAENLPSSSDANLLQQQVKVSLPPSGICGVGYLSLLHVLLRAGLINAQGGFCREPANPLGKRLAQTITSINGRAALPLPGGMFLFGGDIEEILKVKAAFSLAVDSLLRTARIRAGDLKHIFLAGALGEHVDTADIEALGFIPQGLGRKVEHTGNSSLAGAALLLTDRSWRGRIENWRQGCVLVDLTQTENFDSAFARRMKFGY